MTIYIYIFFLLKGILAKEKPNCVEEKSRLSPADLVKKTVGEIEAESAGPASIGGVLTLLF